MIWITNGVQNKYIEKDKNIPLNWYKGCTQLERKPEWRQSLKNSWKKNKQNRVGKNHPMYNKGYLVKGERNGRYGKPLRYINNGVNNKMVPLDSVSLYLEKGWKLGQCENKSIKHKVCINKSNKCKYISKTEVQYYLEKGWKLGNPRCANKGSKNGAFGKVWIHRDNELKRIEPESLQQYLNEGWFKGMLKRKRIIN